MGMVGTIISTLAMGYMQGKAQQDQYNAMARQADANAQISELNARKAEEAAREQDKANKINEENEHRRNLLAMSRQRAAIGASGITATGSALNALQDSRQAIETDAGIQAYSNRQKVQGIFDQSTEQVNARDQYSRQASNYRKAGSAAMTNAMLGSVFSLAAGLYTPGSAAVKSAGSAGGGGSWADMFSVSGTQHNMLNPYSFGRYKMGAFTTDLPLSSPNLGLGGSYNDWGW